MRSYKVWGLLGTWVLMGLAGVALGAIGFGMPGQLRLMITLGAALWLSSVALLALRLRDPGRRPDRVRELDGATVIDHDPMWMVGVVWTATWLTGWCLLAAVLWAQAGEPGGVLIALAFALPLGLVLVDALVQQRRGAWVAVGREGVQVQSWTTSTYLAWDDVVSVDVTRLDGRDSVVLLGRPGAASWTGRRLPRARLRRPRLTADHVVIDVDHLLPHSPMLVSALQRWWSEPGSRDEIGTRTATEMLVVPAEVRAPTGSGGRP